MCKLKLSLFFALAFLFSASLVAAQDTGASSTDPQEPTLTESSPGFEASLTALEETLKQLLAEAESLEADSTKLEEALNQALLKLRELSKQLAELQTEASELSDSLMSACERLKSCEQLIAELQAKLTALEAERDAWRMAAIVAGVVAVLAILANFIPR